eukprot:g16747.t1
MAAIDVPLPYFDALAEQLEMRAEQARVLTGSRPFRCFPPPVEVYDRVTAVEKALATYNRQVSGVPVSAQIEAVVRSEFLQFKAIAAELAQDAAGERLEQLRDAAVRTRGVPVGMLAQPIEDYESQRLAAARSNVGAGTLLGPLAMNTVNPAMMGCGGCGLMAAGANPAGGFQSVMALESDGSATFNVEGGSFTDSRSNATAEGLGLLSRESNVPRIYQAAQSYRGLDERFYGCLSLPGNLIFFLLFSIAVILHEDITNTYMIESGLRTHLSDGADDMNDRAGIWEWLESSILPRLFAQTDYLGQPYQNKTEWSRVLTYNQIVGPVIIEQQRSKKAWCNDGDGVTGDMYCYSQRTRSSAAFGSQEPCISNGFNLCCPSGLNS